MSLFGGENIWYCNSKWVWTLQGLTIWSKASNQTPVTRVWLNMCYTHGWHLWTFANDHCSKALCTALGLGAACAELAQSGSKASNSGRQSCLLLHQSVGAIAVDWLSKSRCRCLELCSGVGRISVVRCPLYGGEQNTLFILSTRLFKVRYQHHFRHRICNESTWSPQLLHLSTLAHHSCLFSFLHWHHDRQQKQQPA